MVMQIPTYKRRVERSTSAPGGVSNLQVNTDAWTAPGIALANAGQAVQRWGLEKAELAAKTESSKSVRDLSSQLEDRSRELINNPDPFVASASAPKIFEDIYKKLYNSEELSSKRSKSLFQNKAEAVWRSKLASFNAKNDKRLLDFRKSDLALTATKQSLVIADINASALERRNAYRDLYGEGGAPGLYNSAEAKSLWRADQLEIRRAKISQDIFMGISAAILKGQKYPTNIVANIDELLKKDELLSLVAAKMPKAKIADLQYKLLLRANLLEREADDAEKDRDKRIDANNLDIYKGIFQTDITKKTIEEKRAAIAHLRKSNWPDEKQNKVIDTVLEDIKKFEAGEPLFPEKSVPGAMTVLREAALDNRLTYDILYKAGSSLTEEDYAKGVALFKAERTEAQVFVLKRFKAKFNYVEDLDKSLNPSYNILGRAPDVALSAAKEDMLTYLTENPRASFNEITKRSDEIAKKAFKSFKLVLLPEMKAQVDALTVAIPDIKKPEADVVKITEDYIASAAYGKLGGRDKIKVRSFLQDYKMLQKFVKIADEGGAGE